MHKVLIACVYLSVAGPALAAPYPEHIETKVTLSSGVVVRATIATIAYSSATPEIRAIRWGADNSPQLAPPGRIISALEVYLGKEKLVLPYSAFSDLCDPRTMILRATKRGFEIRINGSDAGGSYEARLFFEEGRLRRRKVVCSENPENAWDETVYHRNFPENW